ncbi:MAG: hypothetical protein LPL29_12575 [Alphaproteobacteria bacterium]|nr:hypothetical protein [Alphaproteobacteria bacterium]MDX5416449.1 hypothetical protein [Alphaproteobacteria bacterium]
MNGLSADEKIGVSVVIVGAFLVAMQFAFPARHWFPVGDIKVESGPEPAALAVSYDREIERTFDGSWRIQIWRVLPDGARIVACNTGLIETTYPAGAKLPEGGIDLAWFVDKHTECLSLAPGHYEMQVTWVINEGGVLLQRSIHRETTFEVTSDG